MPKKLSHTLEVIYEVKKNGLTRINATHVVAQRNHVLFNTVADSYGRQLQKTAAEIDRLLEQSVLAELRSVLEHKYVHHREAIRSFFEQIDRP